LIKAVLILQHGIIPGNLHFREPNEYIDFDSFRLKVVCSETDIDRDGIIGISSFGFGGTNAHVIIKGAEDTSRKEIRDVPMPFDRARAEPLGGYLAHDEAAHVEQEEDSAETPSREEIERYVIEQFRELTGIEEIDPDIELTEQGLTSLSATALISQLDSMFRVEVDADVLFEYPLLDQFVDHLAGLVAARPA